VYWDVVEVKPEPHYCLFVRFKAGATGCVRLRPEELTGVLAPLRDERFFKQVFIDYGAVAWPGEIDLAPDAMYAQVASQRDDRRSGGRVSETSKRADTSEWSRPLECDGAQNEPPCLPKMPLDEASQGLKS